MSERPKDSERSKRSAKRNLKSFEGLDAALRAMPQQVSTPEPRIPKREAAPQPQPEEDQELQITEHLPVLGVSYTHNFTKETVAQDLVPRIREALERSGMDTEKAQELIDASIMEALEHKDPAERERLFKMRLRNLEFTASRNNKAEPSPVKESPANTPESIPSNTPDTNVGEPYKGPRDAGRMLVQRERLKERIGDLRGNETSHRDMLKENADYKSAYSEFVKLKNRLEKLENDEATEKDKQEIQILRDQLAGHLLSFKRFSKNKGIQEEPVVAQPTPAIPPQPAKQGVPKTSGAILSDVRQTSAPMKEQAPQQWNVKVDNLSYNDEALELLKNSLKSEEKKPDVKEESHSPYEWHTKADPVTYDADTLAMLKKSIEKPEEKKKDETLESSPYEWHAKADTVTFNQEGLPKQGETPKEKAYEARLESRVKYQRAKKAYEDAYAAHLTAEKSLGDRLKGLFGRDTRPEKLIQLEKEYQDARGGYAGGLQKAFAERYKGAEKKEKDEALYGLDAGLANRFIIRAAHDKLALEREFIPKGRAEKVFTDMENVFKKHGKTLKRVGWLTAGGIGLATGGFGYALLALAGKAGMAKVVGAAAAGSALAMNFGYDIAILNQSEKRRNASMEDARDSFSLKRIQELEDEYLKDYRHYEAAARNKKYVVAGAAIAGGVAAGMLAGNIDAEAIADAVPGDAPLVPPAPEGGEVIGIPPATPVIEQDLPPLTPDTPLTPLTPLPGDDSFDKSIDKEDLDERLDLKNPGRDDGFGDDDDDYYYDADDEAPPPDDEHNELDASILSFTFEEGSKVDTVSEALYESWKDNPSLVEEGVTQKEFLAQMYAAIAEIEKNPELNAELMEQMGISSGDIDKVQVGQTINLQPFYEYMNNR